MVTSSAAKCPHCDTRNWLRDEIGNLVFDKDDKLICGFCLYERYVLRVVVYDVNAELESDKNRVVWYEDETTKNKWSRE
jgi:hypothetical protein